MSTSVLFFYGSLVLSYILVRPLATIVHEMGHLAYLMMIGTPEEIKVFVGSLGEGKRAFRFRTGRVLWVIHPSCLLMRGGLCDYHRPLKNSQMIPFAIMGPLFSLGMATIAIAANIATIGSGMGTWANPFLIMSAIIPIVDFLHAWIGTYDPILLSAASVTGNDGQIITWRLQYKSATDAYLHGWWLFEKERYAAANEHFLKAWNLGCRSTELFEFLIFCDLMQREFHKAIEWYLRMPRKNPIDPHVICKYALALEAIGQAPQAQMALDAALRSTPGHFEALNQRAYQAILNGSPGAAKADLDKAIQSNPDFAPAFNNRAWIALMDADPDKAFPDLVKAMKLENENPYLHRNWTIYHCLKCDPKTAAESLESAALLGLERVENAALQTRIDAIDSCH